MSSVDQNHILEVRRLFTEFYQDHVSSTDTDIAMERKYREAIREIHDKGFTPEVIFYAIKDTPFQEKLDERGRGTLREMPYIDEVIDKPESHFENSTQSDSLDTNIAPAELNPAAIGHMTSRELIEEINKPRDYSDPINQEIAFHLHEQAKHLDHEHPGGNPDLIEAIRKLEEEEHASKFLRKYDPDTYIDAAYGSPKWHENDMQFNQRRLVDYQPDSDPDKKTLSALIEAGMNSYAEAVKAHNKLYKDNEGHPDKESEEYTKKKEEEEELLRAINNLRANIQDRDPSKLKNPYDPETFQEGEGMEFGIDQDKRDKLEFVMHCYDTNPYHTAIGASFHELQNAISDIAATGIFHRLMYGVAAVAYGLQYVGNNLEIGFCRVMQEKLPGDYPNTLGKWEKNARERLQAAIGDGDHDSAAKVAIKRFFGWTTPEDRIPPGMLANIDFMETSLSNFKGFRDGNSADIYLRRLKQLPQGPNNNPKADAKEKSGVSLEEDPSSNKPPVEASVTTGAAPKPGVTANVTSNPTPATTAELTQDEIPAPKPTAKAQAGGESEPDVADLSQAGRRESDASDATTTLDPEEDPSIGAQLFGPHSPESYEQPELQARDVSTGSFDDENLAELNLSDNMRPHGMTSAFQVSKEHSASIIELAQPSAEAKATETSENAPERHNRGPTVSMST